MECVASKETCRKRPFHWVHTHSHSPSHTHKSTPTYYNSRNVMLVETLKRCHVEIIACCVFLGKYFPETNFLSDWSLFPRTIRLILFILCKWGNYHLVTASELKQWGWTGRQPTSEVWLLSMAVVVEGRGNQLETEQRVSSCNSCLFTCPAVT